MKLLLVAATHAEIAPLLSQFPNHEIQNELILGGSSVKILITGVGMVATAFSMGQHLASHSYDLALNLGIAGSFDFNLVLGDVVMVTEDLFAEQGAEDGEEFLPIAELGFGEGRQFPVCSLQSKELDLKFPELTTLKQVKAITVNQVHGNELSIAKIIARFNPQIESMEGAAFFYACNQTSTPCIQIRSISNYVERRNREKWNIGLAVNNLNTFAIKFLNALNSN